MRCAKCQAELRQEPYQYSGLLICEGPSDVALIRELLRVRGGPNIHIRAAGDYGQGSGRDAFGKALRSAIVPAGFEKITKVVLATDNDINQQASFDVVKRQIVELRTAPSNPVKIFPEPIAPGVTAAGAPSLTVLMIPTNTNVGSLETLAYLSADSVNANNVAEVDSLAVKTGVMAWAPQKQAKMKVRSFIACTHATSPDIGLGNLWSQGAGHLVPLTHNAFDHLFDSLVALFQ